MRTSASAFYARQVEQVIRNLKSDGLRLEEVAQYLLTDGYSVYFATTDSQVVDILKHRRQLLLLVPIKEQADKLREVA